MDAKVERLTEAQFATAVGLSQDTIYRLRKASRIPYIKIGRLIFYLPRHIAEFNERFERPARVATMNSARKAG